ncbi:hypothetical protein [Sulfurimonas paralvinellae]|uniref:Uncharacterized protein n=1 Tax=Sulfurimonas paralvinellae TaxID=317658 RepID=A0A7M1BAS6_9BACT|nr:hypothetical protein [Sulfurimonas paralvinellae]QOP45872.1 hypothetical protein FM071_06040 [Sulfurimonas paralvinellae]
MIRQVVLYEIIAGLILYETKQLSHHFWFVDFGWEVVFLIMVVVPAVYILTNIHVWLPKLFSGIKIYYKTILVLIAFVISITAYNDSKDQEKQKKYELELKQKRLKRAEKQLKSKGYFVLPGEKIICFYDIGCKQYAMYGYITYSNNPTMPAKWFWDFIGGTDSNATKEELRKEALKRLQMIEKEVKNNGMVSVRIKDGVYETKFIRDEYYNEDIPTKEELYRLKRKQAFSHIKQVPEHIYWKRKLFED